MPSEHPFESVPDCLGHTIHSDLKVLPFESFRGYKYVINFIDSFSRLGFCYFLRSKTEVIAAFRQYIADMKRFGVRIQNIRTDRGSEYFEQEGDALFNRARLLYQFSVV
jgi:transposase